MENLTTRQADVLDAVRWLTLAQGYPPTIRQLCDDLQLASPASVHDHVTELERKGRITRSPDSRRFIQIVTQPERPQP